MHRSIGIREIAAITAGTLLLLLAVSLEAKGQGAAMVQRAAAPTRTTTPLQTSRQARDQAPAQGRFFRPS